MRDDRLRRRGQVEPKLDAIRGGRFDRRAAPIGLGQPHHKLNEDLGVQPEKETILLYEQIRETLFGEVTRVETSRRHNLPAELSPLVGRNTELVEIDQLLADRSCRLLSLIGPGGSGKTRLALEVARHQIERFPDGVYIVSLEPFQSVEAVISAIAHVLGFTLLQADNSRRMLLDNLRQKKLLLILDSFEHVPEAAVLVVDILWTAGGVKILATSRERLNLQDEHIIPLGGLVSSTNAVMPQRSAGTTSSSWTATM